MKAPRDSEIPFGAFLTIHSIDQFSLKEYRQFQNNNTRMEGTDVQVKMDSCFRSGSHCGATEFR